MLIDSFAVSYRNYTPEVARFAGLKNRGALDPCHNDRVSPFVRCAMITPVGRSVVMYIAASCQVSELIVLQESRTLSAAEASLLGSWELHAVPTPAGAGRVLFAASVLAHKSGHYHHVCCCRGWGTGFQSCAASCSPAPCRDGQHYHGFKSALCRPRQCSQLHRRCRSCRGCGHV